jgi:hypothetical protein
MIIIMITTMLLRPPPKPPKPKPMNITSFKIQLFDCVVDLSYAGRVCFAIGGKASGSDTYRVLARNRQYRGLIYFKYGVLYFYNIIWFCNRIIPTLLGLC